MIQVSDAFKKLMNSNIRPKAEPIIKLYSSILPPESNDYIEVLQHTWNGNNIKDFSYKRAIDPVGRELPYMELTWTEIYYGKLNSQGLTDEYENIIKFMPVDLSFVQRLDFFNTWETEYDSKKTWDDLYENNETWESLYESAPTEEIKMPRMYLEAKPVINGLTITWKAHDLLYYCDLRQYRGIGSDRNYTGLLQYPLRNLILEQRALFTDSYPIWNSLTKTSNAINNNELYNQLPRNDLIVIDGLTKDYLKNFANLANVFWTFKEDHAILTKDFNHTDYVFSRKVIKENPHITAGINISSFQFKSYLIKFNGQQKTIKPYSAVIENLPKSRAFSYTFNYTLWNFDGLGAVNHYILAPEEENMPDDSHAYYSRLDLAAGFGLGSIVIDVMDKVAKNNTIKLNFDGEPYIEDNPINTYDNATAEAKSRAEFLSRYFNKNNSSLEFEGLANVALECGDVVGVETNLYDENNNKITKNAVIVNIEITYNGVLKQKTIAHEVN